MSKLDRFLVSENFFDVFPNSIGVILTKGTPDHRSILLKENLADFDPTPFIFFHSWLDLEGFHDLVRDTWTNDGISEGNGLVSFKKKLQNLKQAIRAWNATKRLESSKIKKELILRLFVIDAKIDQSIASELDLAARRDLTKTMGDLDRVEAKDLA